MAVYTVNMPLTTEQTRRLQFLAEKRQHARRKVAYDLLTRALAEVVVGDELMNEEYERWLKAGPRRLLE